MHTKIHIDLSDPIQWMANQRGLPKRILIDLVTEFDYEKPMQILVPHMNGQEIGRKLIQRVRSELSRLRDKVRIEGEKPKTFKIFSQIERVEENELVIITKSRGSIPRQELEKAFAPNLWSSR